MEPPSPPQSSPPSSPTSVTTPASAIWVDETQAVVHPALEEASTFSSFQQRQERWQELERKRLALHRMRQHLEQRIHDFVDREKRAKQQQQQQQQQSSEEDDQSAENETEASQTSTLSSPLRLLPLNGVLEGETSEQKLIRDRRGRPPRCVSPDFSPKTSRKKKTSRRPRTHELCFADGQVYQGDLVDGHREGNGTNKWPNGQMYRGEWLANRRHGRGTHTWPDGRTATGQWYKGHLHGRVLVSWPNGASYDGECQAGQKHGRGENSTESIEGKQNIDDVAHPSPLSHSVGVWIDSKGSKYSGNFVNDKEHGFGTLTHLDGRKYRGQFQDGDKHGYGIQVWPTRTYDGEWAEGKFHGRGKLVWSTGATYTGQFLEGSYHGMGVYTWPSGKKYVGEWDRGRKHGHGVYTWPTGKKYSGEYHKGMKHGYGRMEWGDGRVYCGSWKEGDRWGRGVQTNADGSVFHCGMWIEDEPVGSYAFPSSSSIAGMEYYPGLRDEANVGSRLRLMSL